jgi:hypothetical protein
VVVVASDNPTKIKYGPNYNLFDFYPKFDAHLIQKNYAKYHSLLWLALLITFFKNELNWTMFYEFFSNGQT